MQERNPNKNVSGYLNNFLMTNKDESNHMARQRSKIEDEFKEPIPRKNSVSPNQQIP
jgi:hypothetical protein